MACIWVVMSGGSYRLPVSEDVFDEIFSILSATVDPSKWTRTVTCITIQCEAVNAGHCEVSALWFEPRRRRLPGETVD